VEVQYRPATAPNGNPRQAPATSDTNQGDSAAPNTPIHRNCGPQPFFRDVRPAGPNTPSPVKPLRRSQPERLVRRIALLTRPRGAGLCAFTPADAPPWCWCRAQSTATPAPDVPTVERAPSARALAVSRTSALPQVGQLL